jgi:hypothetical protein
MTWSARTVDPFRLNVAHPNREEGKTGRKPGRLWHLLGDVSVDTERVYTP